MPDLVATSHCCAGYSIVGAIFTVSRVETNWVESWVELRKYTTYYFTFIVHTSKKCALLLDDLIWFDLIWGMGGGRVFCVCLWCLYWWDGLIKYTLLKKKRRKKKEMTEEFNSNMCLFIPLISLPRGVVTIRLNVFLFRGLISFRIIYHLILITHINLYFSFVPFIYFIRITLNDLYFFCYNNSYG